MVLILPMRNGNYKSGMWIMKDNEFLSYL